MEIEPLGIVIRLVLGLVIGFCIGLTGVGGGVLVIPSLILIVNLPASYAVGTASFYAFLTKIYATYRHFRLGNIAWKTASFILVGAVPAGILVSWLINRHIADLINHPEALAAFEYVLKIFIAMVIFGSALVLLYNTFIRKRIPRTQHEGPAAALEIPKRRRVAVVAGALIGGLIGATSVGGGVLIIPTLIVVFGMSAARTIGSSIFIALVLTLFTSLIYYSGNQLDMNTALIMAVGSLGGVEIGGRVSVIISERKLKAVVIAIILISSILMLFK